MPTTANKSGRPFGLLVGGLIFFICIIVLLALTLELTHWRRNAPKPLPVLFSIPDFTLTNQLGQAVSRSDLAGRVWIADIIFTRCAGPCPKMTQRMSEIQAALAPGNRVRLVSLTTDADYDTPPVLRAYGKRYHANPDQWWFLTGEKRAIANLAIDGFKFIAAEKKPEDRTDPADLFVHSTYFVLVDQHGQARAVFNYEEPEMKTHLLDAIKRLLKEPTNKRPPGETKAAVGLAHGYPESLRIYLPHCWA